MSHSHVHYALYKKLITDIAEALQPDDISKLAYHQDLAVSSNQPGLDLLKQLERGGKIGPTKIQRLIDMLENIHRSDLVESKIKPFEKTYALSMQDPNASAAEYSSLPCYSHSEPMASHPPLSREPLSLPSQESSESSYRPEIPTEQPHHKPGISASASFTSFSSYCEPITEEELPIESGESDDQTVVCKYTSLPGDLNQLKTQDSFKKNTIGGEAPITIGFDKPQISTPEQSRRPYPSNSKPSLPLHSHYGTNTMHKASSRHPRETYPPRGRRYPQRNINSYSTRPQANQHSTREYVSQATPPPHPQHQPNSRTTEHSSRSMIRSTDSEISKSTPTNQNCDKSLNEFPMEGESTAVPSSSDKIPVQEQQTLRANSLSSLHTVPFHGSINSGSVGVLGSRELPTLDSASYCPSSDHEMLHRELATSMYMQQDVMLGASIQPHNVIQAPRQPQGKQLKNSLEWNVKCTTLIKHVHKKKTAPLEKKFYLPVGCKYGRKIKVRLLLFPFETTLKRYLSLQAIATIPSKCSQRRWFVEMCKCSYRLSVDVTNPTNSSRIVEPKSKQVEIALSESFEDHCTHIDIDNVLPHDEILYHDKLCFFISLELLMNGYCPTDGCQGFGVMDNVEHEKYTYTEVIKTYV